MIGIEGVAEVLRELPCTKINLIDVGCFGSGETRSFHKIIGSRELFSIGIDPVNHKSEFSFTHFVQAAIRNCEPTTATFYQYNDASCSSLLKIKDNIVTHNANEKHVKWYADRVFENLKGTVQVSVLPLSAVIEQYGLTDSILHFVKVDAQGLDLEVFLSMGKYIKNCLFFQMETVTSHSKDIVLYEGQGIYEEERPVIESYGFTVFSEIDYGATGASPESDVVFVNTKLLENIKAGTANE